ncbi:MAG: hypothetical protein ACHRHE_05620 [Tepidisphaerales bacterium]
MPDGDTNSAAGIYCRKCGYDLRAQAGPYRCPECGRNFDPADRKTFLARPPRGAAWRWAKRGVLLLLLPGVLLAMCWGWLYWGWKNEQVAVAKMDAHVYESMPLGGTTLMHRFGSAGWVLDRAMGVRLPKSTTDAHLVYLKELKGLQMLGLSGTRVTDAGLVHLKDLTGLEDIFLEGTQITDAGLDHLKEIKGMRRLFLADTRITDAGLAHIDDLKELTYLELQDTKVTDAGLAHIKGFTRLDSLGLQHTQITDAGLVHLEQLKGLEVLYLSGTNVTDAGLAYLKELKRLKLVHLDGTKVTAAGVAELRAALPGVYICGPSIR